MKIPKKVFDFLDNHIWIGSEKFFVLLLEHLSSADSVITGSSKISDLIKADVFQLNLCQNDKAIG